jgi:hypothetical protein
MRGGAAGRYLLVLVGVLPVLFFHSPGTDDVRTWMVWMDHADSLGIRAGYAANRSDYPPLSSIILFGVSELSRLANLSLFTGFKLSLLAALLLTSLIFFKWTKDPILTSILQLSLVLNSMALGYIDIYIAPPLILSFWALSTRNLPLFSASFTLACLIKWQPVILAPFAVVYLTGIKSLGRFKAVDGKPLLASVGLPSALFLAPVLGVFGLEVALAFGRASFHSYLSGNALNLTWIMTYFLHVCLPDRFGPLVDGRATGIMTRELEIVLLPKLAFALSYGLALYALIKREKTLENLLEFALIGYFAYFTFNTGVHENHLFTPLILSLILSWMNPAHLRMSLAIALFANLNLFLFYGVHGRGLGFSRVVGIDLGLLFSILCLILFAILFVPVVKSIRGQSGTAVRESEV